jgi:hypothetical protein
VSAAIAVMTPRRPSNPLVGLLVVALIAWALVSACGCATGRGHRTPAEPAKLRDNSPHVHLTITERRQHRDVTSVHVLAILEGDPALGADWFCLQPEWWREGERRDPDPRHHGPCGSIAIDKSWDHWFDLDGAGIKNVYVTLWDRRGHDIASDHAAVPLFGSRMEAR